jgi:hypothetical protein
VSGVIFVFMMFTSAVAEIPNARVFVPVAGIALWLFLTVIANIVSALHLMGVI